MLSSSRSPIGPIRTPRFPEANCLVAPTSAFTWRKMKRSPPIKAATSARMPTRATPATFFLKALSMGPKAAFSDMPMAT